MSDPEWLAAMPGVLCADVGSVVRFGHAGLSARAGVSISFASFGMESRHERDQ